MRDCRVTQSLPFMEAAILDALHAHRYKPATVQGRPVDLPCTFTIQRVLPEYLRKSKPRP